VRGIGCVTETVSPGQIFIPFHYAEANANGCRARSIVLGEPSYKGGGTVESAVKEAVR
jgi:hypothetical protein